LLLFFKKEALPFAMFARTNYLRPRTDRAPVTQIESFFDLVFAFAVTQLSTALRSHLSPLGFLHTLMLFAAIWWVWVYTTWATNWLEPRHRPVRLLLIALMGLGLVLSAALPAAFLQRGLQFAAAYVAMQLVRNLFMLWALHRFDQSNFRNLSRITVWFAASSLAWLAGGFTPSAARTLLWLSALVLDIAAPAVSFYVPGLGRSTTADWTIDSFHLAERCAGFILIALGESITVIGGNFFTLAWNAGNVAAVAAAFLGAACLWWIYFDKAAERTAEAFAKAGDRGAIARSAYTYVHGMLVAGIIAVAAGDALIIDRPFAPVGLAAGLMVLGGPAVYLLGNGIFRRLLHPRFPRSHGYGLALLASLALAAPFMPLLALESATSAVLLIVITLSDILLMQPARK
jgi:low temperature requirement protein LtrA